MLDFVVAAACNSEAILSANLARSPLLAGRPLHAEWGAPSASVAGNRAIDATTAPVVVLAHQDVYLPKGWDALLAARIREVEAVDPGWGLLSAFGVSLNAVNVGAVWSSSLGAIVGRVPMKPEAAQSYDEMLIILRRASGLRFDETLPGWHLHGTDIVTEARSRGLGAWVASLPCIHNDRFHEGLGPDYVECYKAMQRKWADRLPLYSPITPLTRWGLPLHRDRWRMRRSVGHRLGGAIGTDTPVEELARRCGWLDLAPNA